MGQLVNLTRNQEVLQGYQIENNTDLYTVWDWALNRGYTGHLNGDTNGNRTIGLTAPGGNVSQSASIGDWAVLKNDITVTLVPASQAPALYSLAP